MHSLQHYTTIGWREWVALPKLFSGHIKAKIDTGAKTSTLHAIDIQTYRSNGKDRVKFTIHPLQYNDLFAVHCSALLVDKRTITDSGGNRENRCIIRTPIILGELQWEIELTLTDRSSMNHRMLIGRTAIKGDFLVNVDSSFLLGKS